MDEEKKKQIEKYAPFIEGDKEMKDMAMYDELCSINESLQKIAEKEMPEMPKMEMPEVHKVEIEGAEVLTIKGEAGIKGDTGERGIQGIAGKDGVNGKDGRNGIDGQNGLDGKDGIDGKDGENGKDGSPDTPDQIKDKLNQLEEAIELDVIKGLKKKLEDLEKKWSSRPMFGGGGFNYGALNIHILDLYTPTGDVDGINTAFLLSHAPNPISSVEVYLNGQLQDLTNDYTISGSTVSFVSAPLTGDRVRVKHRI